MKVILSTLIFLGMVHAQEITLNDILENSEQKELLTRAISQEGLALESKNLADTQTDPFTFNQSLARANGVGISGYEHEVSLSKEFKLGNIQDLEQKQSRLNNEAHLLEQERYLIGFDNRLKNLYHQYCLGVSYLSSFQEGYDNFSTLYSKKERAYQHDEIAKTELLQLEFEKNRLQIELENLQRKQESLKSQLLSLTSLNATGYLFCQDIYPIVQEVHLGADAFSLSEEAYSKRIESTQVGLNRYAKKLESVEVSMGYAKELETDIYSIGVSIPLNFSSNKSEHERASLMYQSSAISLQNEQQMANKKYQVRELEAELSRSFQNIEAQKDNINHYVSILLPLMKKSYDYGESSVMEYLLSEQKLHTLRQALLEKQKAYYATLFQLYSMSETKDNK
ncbi:MAG TPA: TolC family protein [Campylobacterales bacterium]|nr:TolC family protein [Campylobacterales bacterium]